MPRAQLLFFIKPRPTSAHVHFERGVSGTCTVLSQQTAVLGSQLHRSYIENVLISSVHISRGHCSQSHIRDVLSIHLPYVLVHACCRWMQDALSGRQSAILCSWRALSWMQFAFFMQAICHYMHDTWLSCMQHALLCRELALTEPPALQMQSLGMQL